MKLAEITQVVNTSKKREDVQGLSAAAFQHLEACTRCDSRQLCYSQTFYVVQRTPFCQIKQFNIVFLQIVSTRVLRNKLVFNTKVQITLKFSIFFFVLKESLVNDFQKQISKAYLSMIRLVLHI